MTPEKSPSDTLTQLLPEADKRTLIAMIEKITEGDDKLALECSRFLQSHFAQTSSNPFDEIDAQAWSIWHMLLDDLEDLDLYGGADEDIMDEVYSQIRTLADTLSNGKASAACRHKIQSLAMPFLISGNSGMEDVLYELVQACCHDKDDWTRLAATLENTDGAYSTELAIEIYRRIGEDARYLELRNARLYSPDCYLDLASYYVERGDTERAVGVVEQALEIGQEKRRLSHRWPLEGLLKFLSEHTKRIGQREHHLELEFELATLRLTGATYLTFASLCTAEEWERFEPRLLAHIPKAGRPQQVDIYLHRRQYDQALAALTQSDGEDRGSGLNATESRQAVTLEQHCPQEILAFYLHRIGDITRDKRSIYENKCHQLCAIRRVLVEILHDDTRWLELKATIQKATSNLPAFQHELIKNVPEWQIR